MAGSKTDGRAARRPADPRAALVERLSGSGLDEPRRQALAGLPQRRTESWRHSSVDRFYETVLDQLDSRAPVRPAAVNGSDVLAPADVEVAALDAASAPGAALADHPLAVVHAQLGGPAVLIRAARGASVEEPVRIGPLGACQRVVVVVEEQAALTVVEEPAEFVLRLCEVRVGAGGRLRHLRRQAPSDGAQCSLVAADVAAGGRYALALSARGARLRRNEVVATLGGEGAEASLSGVWRLGDREHLDNQMTVRHAEPGGTSRQLYRGVVGGHARAVLNGSIHIAPGAQRTAASLSSKNWLADDTAEVFAKPELVIHADDVQCSHGASVGTLDAEAVHYLRSRGVDPEVARTLLTRGFLREAAADREGAEDLALI